MTGGKGTVFYERGEKGKMSILFNQKRKRERKRVFLLLGEEEKGY